MDFRCRSRFHAWFFLFIFSVPICDCFQPQTNLFRNLVIRISSVQTRSDAGETTLRLFFNVFAEHMPVDFEQGRLELVTVVHTRDNVST